MTAAGSVIGRLRTTDDFKIVISKGMRIRSGHLSLTYLANGTGEMRLGVNIPGHTAKSAVRRNRLRRVVREGLRMMAGRLALGIDFVVTVSADPGRGEGEIIRSELNELIDKGRLWRNAEE